MMMRRSDKEVVVDSVSELYRKYACAIVVRRVGLSALSVAKLRRDARDAGVVFKVIKNSLAKRALPEGAERLGEGFSGSTGVFFSNDPIASAKLIAEFSKKREENFFPIVGYLDGNVLSGSEVKALANIPPMHQLRSQLLGILQAPVVRLISTMRGPSRCVVQILTAYQQRT